MTVSAIRLGPGEGTADNNWFKSILVIPEGISERLS